MNSKGPWTISGEERSLILFADVIDSSKHSAVLSIQEYAKRISLFQKLFRELSESYFPWKRTPTSLSLSRLRGDEGTVFCVDPNTKPQDLVNLAVQFALELKAKARVMPDPNPSPRPMDIAIGIHFGRVATIAGLEETEKERPKSVIHDIEGFAINYAKRIESSSRAGKYSKIFLSQEAALLLDGDPIVLHRHVLPLKGINDSEVIFEVQSSYFDKMPRNISDKYYQNFVDAYVYALQDVDLVRDPWIKSVIVSAIESKTKSAADLSLKSDYAGKLSKFIWQNVSEDDPMVLFLRAVECGRNGKSTQKLSYLRELVQKFPSFVHARKQLVGVCWQIADGNPERAEIVVARDIADEFLTRFPDYLTASEKESFENIRNKLANEAKEDGPQVTQ